MFVCQGVADSWLSWLQLKSFLFVVTIVRTGVVAIIVAGVADDIIVSVVVIVTVIILSLLALWSLHAKFLLLASLVSLAAWIKLLLLFLQ